MRFAACFQVVKNLNKSGHTENDDVNLSTASFHKNTVLHPSKDVRQTALSFRAGTCCQVFLSSKQCACKPRIALRWTLPTRQSTLSPTTKSERTVRKKVRRTESRKIRAQTADEMRRRSWLYSTWEPRSWSFQNLRWSSRRSGLPRSCGTTRLFYPRTCREGPTPRLLVNTVISHRRKCSVRWRKTSPLKLRRIPLPSIYWARSPKTSTIERRIVDTLNSFGRKALVLKNTNVFLTRRAFLFFAILFPDIQNKKGSSLIMLRFVVYKPLLLIYCRKSLLQRTNHIYSSRTYQSRSHWWDTATDKSLFAVLDFVLVLRAHWLALLHSHVMKNDDAHHDRRHYIHVHEVRWVCDNLSLDLRHAKGALKIFAHWFLQLHE